MKDIFDFILDNKTVKRLAIILSIISILLLFNKFIFSFLSIPWAVAYFITSNINWQFDQSIFVDIFNVDDGLDKIRILNLLLLWIYYWWIMKLLDITINIFYTDKWKNYSFRDLKSVKIIYFIVILCFFIFLLCYNLINSYNHNVYLYFLPNYLPFIIFILLKIFLDKLSLDWKIMKIMRCIFWKELSNKIFNNYILYFKNNLLIFTLFILSFTFFISVREINNQSVFQWVLPTKWYVLLNDNDEKLKEFHNKLQLPSDNTSNQVELIKKINYIDEKYEWRILAWFCILWENNNYYYISPYFRSIKTRDCYRYDSIQPIRIEKEDSFLIRYLKNANFKNMNESIYSKLLSSSDWYNIDVIYDNFYEYLTALYNTKWETSISDFFYNAYYKFNDNLYLDNLYSYYFSSFLNNSQINLNELTWEINKRDELKNKFYKWNNEILKSLFISESDFKKLGMDYINNLKYDDTNFKTNIVSALRNNSKIHIIDNKQNFLIINWTVINGTYVSELRSIKFLESNYFSNFMDDEVINTWSWIFNEWCIEILNENKLVYNIDNVKIKYNYSTQTKKYYDYNYDIDLNWSSIDYWSCSFKYN